MPLLFSYGTLQQAPVQLSIFGRFLLGAADKLSGFELSVVSSGDAGRRGADGERQYANAVFNGQSDTEISGTVFEISEAELLAADQYEEDAAYIRILVRLVSGEEAWVYVSARSRGGLDLNPPSN